MAWVGANDMRRANNQTHCRDNLLVFSGGTPIDMVDGDNFTVVEGQELMTVQLTSGVRAMHVLEMAQSDMDSGMVDTVGSAEPLSTSGEQ